MSKQRWMLSGIVERVANAVRFGRRRSSLEAQAIPPDEPPPTPRAGTSIPPESPAALADLGTRLLEQIPSGLSPKIADRFLTLCQDSETRGEPAIHCQETRCVPNAFCSCGCEGCLRATLFLRRAQQDTTSRGGGAAA